MVAVRPRTPRAGRQQQAADPRPMPLEGASLSDRGQVRDINEDAVHLEPPSSVEAQARGVLCVLADGMGGYAAGEVASRLAVQSIRNRYYSSPSTYIVDALRGAVEAANRDIWEQGQHQAEQSGMGCTLTAAVVLGDNLVVSHVGDSRAYLVRGQGIAQITEDHSWVAEQVAAGAMTPEQANNHPQRNVILRALGARSSVNVDVYQEKVLPGDMLVLCSDGLSTLVSDEEIGRTAQDFPPEQAVRRLVTLANNRGAPDNVTVAVLRVLAPARAWGRVRRLAPLLAPIAVLVILGAAIGLASRNDISTTVTGEPDSAIPSPTEVLTPDAAVLGTIGPTVLPSGETRRVGTITAERVKLRKSPSTRPDSTVLTTLSSGASVVIEEQTTGDVPRDETDNRWYRVSVPALSLSGFVYGRYVQVNPEGVTPGGTPASAVPTQ